MEEKFKIVCWLWTKNENQPWRGNMYQPEHVLALQNMFAHYLQIPHQLICITDTPEALPPEIETFELWQEPYVATQPNRPNCYKRLKMFSDWAHQEFGPEFLSIDLDVLIWSDITAFVEEARNYDFKIAQGGAATYNGSLWYHRTGTRTDLWDDFDPQHSPAQARTVKNKKGKPMFGSDQAWISYKYPNEKIWTFQDGVAHYLNDLHRKRRGGHVFPDENTKIILFPGTSCKPWSLWMEKLNPRMYDAYMRWLR